MRESSPISKPLEKSPKNSNKFPLSILGGANSIQPSPMNLYISMPKGRPLSMSWSFKLISKLRQRSRLSVAFKSSRSEVDERISETITSFRTMSIFSFFRVILISYIALFIFYVRHSATICTFWFAFLRESHSYFNRVQRDSAGFIVVRTEAFLHADGLQNEIMQ